MNDQLNEVLSAPWNADEWESTGLTRALELVSGLRDNEWQELHRSWAKKDAAWQGRLARALAWGEAAQAVPLLQRMIVEGAPEVAVEAATAVWSRLDEHGPEAVPFTEEMVFRIEELAAGESPLMEEFLLQVLELAKVHPD